MKSRYDVVILGAVIMTACRSHLSGAAGSVPAVRENDYIGGATTSQKVFPDYDARLSRYSYRQLVPGKIVHDLGLNLELAQTRGSRSPYLKDDRHDGLLLSNVSEMSRQSMFGLTGNHTKQS
jgi:hypothetical protein